MLWHWLMPTPTDSVGALQLAGSFDRGQDEVRSAERLVARSQQSHDFFSDRRAFDEHGRQVILLLGPTREGQDGMIKLGNNLFGREMAMFTNDVGHAIESELLF